MILRLSPPLQHPQGSMGVAAGVCDYFHELCFTHVVGTGAGHQHSARPQHLQGAKIEFLVAAEGRFEVLAALREGRGIQNDGVVPPSSSRIVLQKIESVRLDPLDLALVQQRVLVGDFQRRSRAIDRVTLPQVLARCRANAPW